MKVFTLMTLLTFALGAYSQDQSQYETTCYTRSYGETGSSIEIEDNGEVSPSVVFGVRLVKNAHMYSEMVNYSFWITYRNVFGQTVSTEAADEFNLIRYDYEHNQAVVYTSFSKQQLALIKDRADGSVVVDTRGSGDVQMSSLSLKNGDIILPNAFKLYPAKCE